MLVIFNTSQFDHQDNETQYIVFVSRSTENLGKPVNVHYIPLCSLNTIEMVSKHK